MICKNPNCATKEELSEYEEECVNLYCVDCCYDNCQCHRFDHDW